MLRRALHVVVCLIFGVGSTAAFAQGEAPPEAPSPAPVLDTPAPELDTRRDWTIRLDPVAWWVSPSGKVRLPSGGATAGGKVRLERLDLDTPELSPAGAVAINAGDFRFSFFGSSYSRDGGTTADSSFRLGDVTLTPGDPFESTFEFSVFELTGAYRFYTYDFKERSEDKAGAADVAIDFYALVGARFFDMSIGVSTGVGGGASSSTDQFFGDILGGIRVEVRLARQFNINAQLTGGGFGDSDRSSFSWDVALAAEWNPLENVGMQFGWRQIAYSFEDGDGAGKFEYDGAMAGVFAGVVIRF